jgi:hypothetical protein
MTAFERADPPFTARAPAQGAPGEPGPALPRLARQHHVTDVAIARGLFVGARRKPGVSDRQGGGVTEQRW